MNDDDYVHDKDDDNDQYLDDGDSITYFNVELLYVKDTFTSYSFHCWRLHSNVS